MDINDTTLFSIYGISINYPKSWKVFFNPKQAFDYNTGFFRLEDYIPKKGAQVSLGINWEKVASDNKSFVSKYCEKINEQFKKQMKKAPFTVETVEEVDFLDGKAAYVVTEYKASPGLIKKKGDAFVRSLQLAYYDENTGRAVVSSIIGWVDKVKGEEDFLKDLIFSVRCS